MVKIQGVVTVRMKTTIEVTVRIKIVRAQLKIETGGRNGRRLRGGRGRGLRGGRGRGLRGGRGRGGRGGHGRGGKKWT